MFKVNSKDSNDAISHLPLVFFHVNFEQVNADWEDDNGFKSTGRVLSFFRFDRAKGLRNRGKSQDYLVSCPIVNF